MRVEHKMREYDIVSMSISETAKGKRNVSEWAKISAKLGENWTGESMGETVRTRGKR